MSTFCYLGVNEIIQLYSSYHILSGSLYVRWVRGFGLTIKLNVHFSLSQWYWYGGTKVILMNLYSEMDFESEKT